MPDWVKRVHKERSADLQGESVRAACYFQGYGSASSQIAYGMTRGILTDVADTPLGTAETFAGRAADRQRRRAEGANTAPDGSIAALFPNTKGVLAVTDGRLIAFTYKQGVFSTKIEEPAVVLPLTQLEGWFFKSGSIASVLSLAFTDDSEIHLELPVANKPNSFADTLQIPRGE